jgi:hypothetical protein
VGSRSIGGGERITSCAADSARYTGGRKDNDPRLASAATTGRGGEAVDGVDGVDGMDGVDGGPAFFRGSRHKVIGSIDQVLGSRF